MLWQIVRQYIKEFPNSFQNRTWELSRLGSKWQIVVNQHVKKNWSTFLGCTGDLQVSESFCSNICFLINKLRDSLFVQSQS